MANKVIDFFKDLISDYERIQYETDSSQSIATQRAQSVIAKVSGIAMAILTSIIFIKTLGLPILTTYLGFSLTAFTAVLAHDLIQVGINQSRRISTTNSLPAEQDTLFGSAKRAGWLLISIGQKIIYSEYQLEGTYLLRPLRDFIITHSQK